MQRLIATIKKQLVQNLSLPFSVYSSIKEQRLLNVPIIKPLLICVLEGCKRLGNDEKINCPSGHFIFLSNNPQIDMRNIPGDKEYFALLIEFDKEDFIGLKPTDSVQRSYIKGHINPLFEGILQQFVEWSTLAPSDMWFLRKQEILQLLYYQGHHDIAQMSVQNSLSHRLHNLLRAKLKENLNTTQLAELMAMSESTLRRKIKNEGNSIQLIKDNVRLSHGLHLIQTTQFSIGLIAEQCGYLSQSRFTDKFKQLFGLTPSELRKTQLNE